MGVVHRTVQGIDDPDAVGLACPSLAAALLGPEPVARECGAQTADDQLLGAVIHLRDEIDAPFVFDFLGFPEILFEEGAGLARDPHRLLELPLEGRGHSAGGYSGVEVMPRDPAAGSADAGDSAPSEDRPDASRPSPFPPSAPARPPFVAAPSRWPWYWSSYSRA